MLDKKNHEYAFESLTTSLFKLHKTGDAIKELNAGLKLFPNNPILLDYKQQFASVESSIIESESRVIESESITCPKCKKDNEKESKFCNSCGSKINEGCVKCSHVNPKDAKFCNDCGYILK